MANNRMYLRNKRTGYVVYLAKYYPSTGWYTVADDLEGVINEAFRVADFGHLSPQDQAICKSKFGFGPPYSAAENVMLGDEWELAYDSTTESRETGLPANVIPVSEIAGDDDCSAIIPAGKK